jgi:hypothetical protein
VWRRWLLATSRSRKREACRLPLEAICDFRFEKLKKQLALRPQQRAAYRVQRVAYRVQRFWISDLVAVS